MNYYSETYAELEDISEEQQRKLLEEENNDF